MECEKLNEIFEKLTEILTELTEVFAKLTEIFAKLNIRMLLSIGGHRKNVQKGSLD